MADDHFAKATAEETGAQRKTAHYTAEQGETEGNEENRGVTEPSEPLNSNELELARQDLNYCANPEENARKRMGAAKSAAVGADSPPITPELALVVDAWETLPEAIKAGILAMVRASGELT